MSGASGCTVFFGLVSPSVWSDRNSCWAFHSSRTGCFRLSRHVSVTGSIDQIDVWKGMVSLGFNTWNRRKLKFFVFLLFISHLLISLIIVETFDSCFFFLFSRLFIFCIFPPIPSIVSRLPPSILFPFLLNNIREWMCYVIWSHVFEILVSVGFLKRCAALFGLRDGYTTEKIVYFVL